MIRIDHISFEFAAADERFVHDLYADWDGFCRNCFEKTVDECFSPLDKDRVLREIELLELDLGGILEEDFYREFPRRLKAELLKVLPSWGIPTERTEKDGCFAPGKSTVLSGTRLSEGGMGRQCFRPDGRIGLGRFTTGTSCREYRISLYEKKSRLAPSVMADK